VSRLAWFRGFTTFRARIFWSVIPIILALLIFHAFMDLREHRRLVEGEFMKRGTAMTGNLASGVELGVFAEDAQLLDSSIRGIVGDPDVAYVFIYGDDNNVLIKGGRQVNERGGVVPGLSADERKRLFESSRPISRHVTVRGGRFVEFFAPVLTETAKTPDELLVEPVGRVGAKAEVGRRHVIGVVRLGLSLGSVEAHVFGLAKLWVGITLVFFALSSVTIYAFSRGISRPIKNLTGHAQKIAEGDLDQTIPVESRDEIGRLAATFNDMARALKQNIHEKERVLTELQDLNRTQEDRIRERTAEIQERTEAVQRSLDEVRTLAEISRAVSSSLDLRQVLSTVAGHAVERSNADASGIFEFNPERKVFEVVASHHLSQEFLDQIRLTTIDPQVGLLRRAAESRQPIQVPELTAASDLYFRDITLQAGFRALMVVPVGSESVTHGIVLFRRTPGLFDDRVVALLSALASQSKVAIENARLFREVEDQRSQLENLTGNLEQLYRLSTAMQEPLSLKEQLSRVLEAARQVVAIDRFYIWLVAPGRDRLIALAGAGFAEADWKDFESAEIPLVEAGAMYKAYREGVPLVFNEENPLPPALRLRSPYSQLKAARTKRFVVVPMIARGRTVGLLTADNKHSSRPINPRTVELLQIFASHAAVAIENARLFQEIEEKGHQLEIASRHKSQFLANMSHELRTPLNAILGYTELVLDSIYGEVPGKIREVMERVDRSGRHLLGLINDVLDLSKIEAGLLTLSLNDYSIRDIVQTVFTAVESLAAEKRLGLKVDMPPELPVGCGDERRVTQVLLNLVGNAIKFTEAGEVGIRVATVNGLFLVSVSDTGPGISARDQQRIFEEFHQVDTSSTRRKGGTGLGLSIAKRIVEMHDGRIWVESRPGEGSTFSFTLPIRVER
jgi:signal transduction histidine kinase